MKLSTKLSFAASTTLILAAGLTFAAAFYGASSLSEKTPQTEPSSGLIYACPMHPEEATDHEGTCRQCGMALQRAKGAKQISGCAGHTSSCCAKPSRNVLRLPPGHPPVAGYTVDTNQPSCHDTSH